MPLFIRHLRVHLEELVQGDFTLSAMTLRVLA